MVKASCVAFPNSTCQQHRHLSRNLPLDFFQPLDTHLVSSRLGNQTEVRNVDCLFQSALIRGIKDRIERNVLQHLVHAEFVRIENHDSAIRDFSPE